MSNKPNGIKNPEMSWSQKLRDPRWQKLKSRILDRDRWRCTICGDTMKNLQVHHAVYTRYNKDPWDYADSTLQTLCEDCHEERQDLIDATANAIKILLMKVPTRRIERCAQTLFNEAMGEL